MDKRQDVGFLIKSISEYIDREANRQLRQYGLTISQGRILTYLHDCQKTVTQKELETYFGVSHPTIVGILKRLEEKELIRSEVNPENRTMKNIYLTEKEASFFQTMRAMQTEMEKKLMNHFQEEEAKQIKILLNMVYENLQ